MSRHRALLSILGALLLAATSWTWAEAVTRLVPSAYPTIAAGLAAAAPGDTVLVACGVYFERGLVLKSGVVVRGASGNAACATIDGQGLGRVFEAAAVDSAARLEAFTITGGDATAGAFFENGGGALRCLDSFVRVRDCNFTGNRAKFGGAVGALGGGPSFVGCTFETNEAAGAEWAAGGALYFRDSSPIVLECTFLSNDASSPGVPGDGGAIFSDSSTLLGADCHFEGNTADAGAGAFYSYSSDGPALTRCTFAGNTANAGGAMYLERSFGAFTECTFDDNVAANGGAVFIAYLGAPILDRCTFTSNESTPFGGGAVDCFRSSPKFLECSFIGNVAATVGGALRFEGASVVEIDRALVAGNTSVLQGGGIHCSGTSVTEVSGTTIHGNSGSAGGGVFVAGDADVTLDRTIVSGALAGGAFACAGNGSATLQDCDVFGNAGGDWTDCIAAQSGVAGNFSADPAYCNAASFDFALTTPGSPCLPGNSPGGSLVGREGVGCGCPAGADWLVPGDFPTVQAALAAASPGQVVGVCSGDWAGAVLVKEGVHLVGAGAGLTRLVANGAAPALLLARGVTDSTSVADLTLDAADVLPHAVLAESTTTGLRLERTRIVGATSWGVVNGPDSRLVLGGSLESANDVFGHGGATPRFLRNDNVTADSLDARLTFWGTTDYATILAAIEGPVLSCPITDATHTKSLCAPLEALDAPAGPPVVGTSLRLAVAPNPFAGETTISFTLDRPGPALARIFDVAGRRVQTVQDGPLPAGFHRFLWKGRRDAGGLAAPGVYFVRLDVAGTGTATTRILLLR